MVKLELYRVFREVAEAGNISLAAENLYLSQSAASFPALAARRHAHRGRPPLI